MKIPPPSNSNRTASPHLLLKAPALVSCLQRNHPKEKLLSNSFKQIPSRLSANQAALKNKQIEIRKQL